MGRGKRVIGKGERRNGFRELGFWFSLGPLAIVKIVKGSRWG